MAIHEEVSVWMAVPENFKTPAKTLSRMAKDRFAVLRWASARNPATPAKALAGLIGEKPLIQFKKS